MAACPTHSWVVYLCVYAHMYPLQPVGRVSVWVWDACMACMMARVCACVCTAGRLSRSRAHELGMTVEEAVALIIRQ